MNKIGRICFVIPSLSSGGAERVVSVLASSLAERNYDITVIKFFGADNEYPISKKVNVINLASGDEKKYNAIPFIKKICILRRLLKDIGAEYTVPFLPYVAVDVWLASFGLKSKYIQTVRNAPGVTPASKLRRGLRDYLVSKSYRTFVQTESQKQYFSPKTQKKIVVLPNPVSSNMFEVNEKKFDKVRRIVSVGRLIEQKNFELAVDSVCILYEQEYDVQLSIYGEGNLKKSLQEYISKKKAESFCFLKGRSDNIAQVLEQSDLFLLSSDFEGMPNCLMEAMAAGLPCVATDCETGPSDLIDKDRGILVPVNDADAMAKALKFLIDNPDAAKQMGKQAKSYMRLNYSSDQIAKRFIKDVIGR